MTTHPHPLEGTAAPRQDDRDTPRRGWAQHAERVAHPSCAPVDGDVIEWIATGLAAVSPAWQLLAQQSPTAHHAERLLSTEAYDAWLVYWPACSRGLWTPSIAAPGVVAVVDGAVRLTTASLDGLRWRSLAAGESSRVGVARQWLANPSAVPATTVHVYSPGLGVLDVEDAA